MSHCMIQTVWFGLYHTVQTWLSILYISLYVCISYCMIQSSIFLTLNLFSPKSLVYLIHNFTSFVHIMIHSQFVSHKPNHHVVAPTGPSEEGNGHDNEHCVATVAHTIYLHVYNRTTVLYNWLHQSYTVFTHIVSISTLQPSWLYIYMAFVKVMNHIIIREKYHR